MKNKLMVIAMSLFMLASVPGLAAAKNLELWSKPVSEGFGEVKPMSISIGTGGEALENARIIPVEVQSYGSGTDVHITLALVDPKAEMTQAELIRSAMAAALTFYQCISLYDDEEDRNVRAEIYPFFTNSYEYNVMLAQAVLDTKVDKSFKYPGPAWVKAVAVKRLPTEKEITYMQEMQLNHFDWGFGDEKQEHMRGKLTADQDAQVSNKLGIKPGTINVKEFMLMPLGK